MHFPDFVPKDGPSAGVTMVTALVSGADEGARAARPRDDGRDHAARARAADRRPQREAPRGAPRRHQHGDPPEGEPEDLRDVPRRVLKATRVVLVDHVDDVLREALVVPDPDADVRAAQAVMEYRGGELVVNGAPTSDDKAEPDTRPAGPVEQPGA